ncbi:hypothetical protein HMPREF3189_00068 [Clostridiales bacterium KA00134]|nr:hypothetical protein HMPREF3189_00068 [Clostridiales bacterium KA00134]
MNICQEYEEDIMNDSIKKIAYLKGLAHGYEVSEKSKEGKLLLEIIDTLADLAESLEEKYSSLEDYVDMIEEDLSELEEVVYDEEDDDFDLYDDDDYEDFDFDDYEDFDFDDDDECECECCHDDGETEE